MSVKDCQQFMEDFSDANATDKEKLEYAQCVNDNVYLVQSHKGSVYDNEPLMFGIIFAIILVLALSLNHYIKKQNKKDTDEHDRNE